MVSNSSALLLIVFIELLVSYGLAQAQISLPPPIIPGLPNTPIPGIPISPIPGVPLPGIPGVPFPGAPIPGIPPALQECWASISHIGGCYPEISRSFQSGGDFTIGPECCKAVVEVSSSCWPKMFPYNPFFPPMLQAYCARYTPPAPETAA